MGFTYKHLSLQRAIVWSVVLICIILSVSYQPNPLDASGVQLNPSIMELAEYLARNTHDVWAKARVSEGWKYGPQRNDDRKEHPGLIPYEELPDSEREYDRLTVLKTLQLIVALGYEINEPSSMVHGASLDRIEKLKSIIYELQSERLSLGQLRSIWEKRDAAIWSFYPEIYLTLAQRFMGQGEPIRGHDVVAEGLKFFGTNLELQKIQALTLAQTGATHTARGILQKLLLHGVQDADTWGILARTHKDLWRRIADPVRKQQELSLSHDYYLRGFKKTGSSYPGINAAALSLLMGNRAEAESLARQVQKACEEEIQKRGENYWSRATMAEASLLLGDIDHARSEYAAAVKMSSDDLAAISSSRRQARMILPYLNKEPDFLDDAFGKFTVLVFVGHMVDAPMRVTPRFTQDMVETVKQKIRSRLDGMDARIGYSSAASGSDILFLEAMLERSGEIHVVLPFHLESFKKVSVDVDAHHEWGKRFDRIIERAASVTCASPNESSGSPAGFEYANRLLMGLATLKARILDTRLQPLAVWNGLPGDGPGGTASCVEGWQKSGHAVDVIHIETKDPILVPQPHSLAVNTQDPLILHQKIKAILFADVVGYSQLTEAEIPCYLEHFMGRLAALIKNTAFQPEVKNTWGDALYMVFGSVREAGNFALELQTMARKTSWQELGLISEIRVRIGLHAGPVFEAADPVTTMNTYTGSHVSRAARIEPIVEEGQIYTSESFAALAAGDGVSDFVCDYVGEKSLAKDEGMSHIYLLRQRGQS
jgi:class 3 adenylate cyclase